MQYASIALALVAGAALAVSAPEAAAQAPQPGTYRLATVGGRPLPATLQQDDRCREELVSGTLELAADGTWSLSTVERDVCGNDVDEDTSRERGRYTVSGSDITFRDEDGDPEDQDVGDDLDVEDLMTGTAGADGLTVRLDDGETEILFQP